MSKYKKMSDEKWLKARKMRENGSGFKEIAQEFGVSAQLVSRTLAGVGDRACTRSKVTNLEKCIYPKIQKFMYENRFSYNRLANSCGIDHVSMYRHLTMENGIPKSSIDAILRVTGMTYEEAFKTKEDSK